MQNEEACPIPDMYGFFLFLFFSLFFFGFNSKLGILDAPSSGSAKTACLVAWPSGRIDADSTRQYLHVPLPRHGLKYNVQVLLSRRRWVCLVSSQPRSEVEGEITCILGSRAGARVVS